VTLDLVGDRDRIMLRHFSANDGGNGSLDLKGNVLLAAKPAPAVDMTVRMSKFQLVHRDDAIAHGSGDLHLAGSFAEPRIIARLRFDDASSICRTACRPAYGISM